jgi:hypothetical protein
MIGKTSGRRQLFTYGACVTLCQRLRRFLAIETCRRYCHGINSPTHARSRWYDWAEALRQSTMEWILLLFS